jgi:hypothetical protein
MITGVPDGACDHFCHLGALFLSSFVAGPSFPAVTMSFKKQCIEMQKLTLLPRTFSSKLSILLSVVRPPTLMSRESTSGYF